MRNREAPARRRVFVAAAFTVTLLLGVILIKARSSESVGYDFISIYAARPTVRAGHRRELYDLQKQAALQWELFHRGGLIVGIHPLFEALLLAPLTKLTYAQAYALWGDVTHLLVHHDRDAMLIGWDQRLLGCQASVAAQRLTAPLCFWLANWMFIHFGEVRSSVRLPKMLTGGE